MNGPSYRILVGDALARLRELPEASVHMVATSPPYWSLRHYGVAGQLGLEATPEEYVASVVEIFREVARVLRPDGTAWVNLGDCYAGGGRGPVGSKVCLDGGVRGHEESRKAQLARGADARRPLAGWKAKDLCGMPWRVAFALQADGWYLRQEVIWHKTNPQPERVEDRPTRAHEQVFLFARRERYYYDADAVRQPVTGNAHPRGTGLHRKAVSNGAAGTRQNASFSGAVSGLVETRNLWSVWTFPTQPSPENHFAAFPEELPTRCILAGTSERGCCSACGAQVVRRMAKRRTVNGQPLTGPARDKSIAAPDRNPGRAGHGHAAIVTYRETLGWRPGCDCGASTVPSTVLDPFAGTGTTGVAALKLGRAFVGVELNPEYAAISRRRLALVAHGALSAARERPQEPNHGPLFEKTP